MKPHTQSFLIAVLFGHENDTFYSQYDAEDFSKPFIDAAESFLDAFKASLPDGALNAIDEQAFGHGVYLSLSGHGAGFWDAIHTEHLQPLLEKFSGRKYRFEQMDIAEDENGKLDLPILPEFIDDYRNKLFAIGTAGKVEA